MSMVPKTTHLAAATIAPLLFFVCIGLMRREAPDKNEKSFGMGSSFIAGHEEARDGKAPNLISWIFDRKYRLGRLLGAK